LKGRSDPLLRTGEKGKYTYLFADIEWDLWLVVLINSETEAWNNCLLINTFFLQHLKKPFALGITQTRIMEYSFALYSSQLKKNPKQPG